MLIKLTLIIHFLAFSAGIGLAIAGTILRKAAVRLKTPRS